MKRTRLILVAKVITALSVVPVIMVAFSTGPAPRKTGAPGDSLCTQCHVGTANSGSGSIQVDFPSGPAYAPGVTQRLTVRISDPQAAVYGFQMTARLASNLTNGQAGDFLPVDSTTQVLCEDGSVKTSTQSCRPDAPVQFIEHTLPRTSGTFSFDWTPPATAAGDVRIYVAANAANGNGSTSGDRIYTANFTLAPAAVSNKPVVNQAQIANAWTNQAPIPDAGWIFIKGANLAPTTRIWDANAEIVNGKLPKSLDGVSVKINNQDAFVYFISPTQINVQAPGDGAVGPVTVQVTNQNGTSDPVVVNKQLVAPGVFTWNGSVPEGEKYIGALFPDSNFTGNPWVGKAGLLQPIGLPTRPAKPGETIIFFATGCGPTNPPVPAGQVVDLQQGVPTLTSPVSVRIGGIPAEVAANTGFLIFAGECQFNVKVPPNAPNGDLLIELQIGAVMAQGNVFVTVQN